MKIEDGEHTCDKADRSTLAAYRGKEYAHYKKIIICLNAHINSPKMVLK